jgi:catechol 2,3-dioxygenase-like lactoylglutathione lyase family enzyme
MTGPIKYDRTAEDVGNLFALEHVNLQVGSLERAAVFYVEALGLTRDPYMMTGSRIGWFNAGRNQFHLVQGSAQVVAGHIGLVMPNRTSLLARLRAAAPLLSGSAFSHEDKDDHVVAVCPWGNRFHIHEPGDAFGRMTLGMPYVELDVQPGTAAGIVAFYRQVIGAPGHLTQVRGAPAARIAVGREQALVFRETREVIRPFDGHHVQVYLSDFSGPHQRLMQRGLVTEESNEYQYRFEAIVDPDTNRVLARIEHEVRSISHPLFNRPLVNRNPDQSNLNYAAGRDAWVPPDTARHSDDPRLRGILHGYAALDADPAEAQQGTA